MNINSFLTSAQQWGLLLRWNKPSGRLILLIPAGWSLCLTPYPLPEWGIFALVIAGGCCVSGAGCIANDLWDKKFDALVARTRERPLAKGSLKTSTAFVLLVLMLSASLLIVFLLPINSREICLSLALLALPPILLYPSAKRWFKYPQILLSICWGFSVLIPWAASESKLNGGWPLVLCWLGTLLWTFGFDTVYAMSDRIDDKKLGLNSSALALGRKTLPIVSICYGFTCSFIATAAFFAQVGWLFWPLWGLASIGMQLEVVKLANSLISTNKYGFHFKNQVWLGSLILLGLVLGRIYV